MGEPDNLEENPTLRPYTSILCPRQVSARVLDGGKGSQWTSSTKQSQIKRQTMRSEHAAVLAISASERSGLSSLALCNVWLGIVPPPHSLVGEHCSLRAKLDAHTRNANGQPRNMGAGRSVARFHSISHVPDFAAFLSMFELQFHTAASSLLVKATQHSTCALGVFTLPLRLARVVFLPPMSNKLYP